MPWRTTTTPVSLPNRTQRRHRTVRWRRARRQIRRRPLHRHIRPRRLGGRPTPHRARGSPCRGCHGPAPRAGVLPSWAVSWCWSSP
ncbi:hypothetical protein DLE01_30435 [Streptomyces sp. FT05W]|nr:hypothetical protein DLE01_30435 [Streptomyces sp. FT05W]